MADRFGMNIPRGEKCPYCHQYSVYKRGKGEDFYWRCRNCGELFTDAELKGKFGMMNTPIGQLFGNEGGHTTGGIGGGKGAGGAETAAATAAVEAVKKEEGKGGPASNTPPSYPMQIPRPPRDPLWSLVLFIIGVSAFSYVYYITPVHGIFDTFRSNLLVSLPKVWSDFIFNFLPGLIILVFFAFTLVGALLKKHVGFETFSNFFYVIGMLYLVTAVMIGIGYIVYVYLLSAGVLTPYLCSLSLKDLLSIDPNAADKCLTQPQAVPDNTKNGITQLDQSTLGGDLTGTTIPTVYQNELYVLPFSVKNLDTGNSLDGVYVKGKIVGETKVNGQLVPNQRIDFVPNVCSADSPCDIIPGTTQVISLQSSDNIPFYSPGYADVTVNTIYPYTGFGAGDVIAAGPDAVIPQNAFTKPESGPGPVDIIVFFAPQSFTTDGRLSKIIMFVDVINKGQGLINARSMLIKRLTSTDILGTATCKVPGFPQAFAENNNQTFDNLEFQSEAQFVCSIPVQQPSTPLTQFEHIKFTATFGYDYIETTTDTYPVKLLG